MIVSGVFISSRPKHRPQIIVAKRNACDVGALESSEAA
jgi:hypothetical protein